MLLSILLIISIGFAIDKKEKSIARKKVVIITSDNEKENRDINIEADVDDKSLKLTITVDGEQKAFEVPLGNGEALEALEKELEELDVDVHITDFKGHDDKGGDGIHAYKNALRWHGKHKSGGYLGVQIQGLEGQLANYFGANDGGVLVTEVVEDSPAENAGLKAGDVILSVEGEQVEDSRDLVEVIRSHNPDSIVELKVIRKNRPRKMKVTLGEIHQSFAFDFDLEHKMMFFGDKDNEDVDILWDKVHARPDKFLRKFKFDEDDIDELEHEIDVLRNEMKKLKEEVNKLKKDS